MPSIATFGSLSARGTGRFNGRSSNVENFEYLVVGGGGGGGGTQEADYGEKGGGGGGAGTYKAGKLSNFSVRSGSTYLITVGAGGNGGPSAVQGGDGGLSQFASITSPGGGGGGAGVALSGVRAGTTDGRSGGNGGGAGGGNRGEGYFGGAGPATDGNRGGGTFSDPTGGAGGGGGDTNFGQPTNISGSDGGNGGFGVQNSITGTALYYSGGGGGGKSAYNAGSNGTGGSGVGGNGGGQDAPFQGAATNTVIWSTLNLGGVSRESNGAYCGFLNSYGVSDGGGLSRDVTINFPQTGTYSFEFSVDNYGSVSLDGTKIYDVEGELNYRSSSAVTRTVTAGNHTLSIRGYNLGDPDGNPFSMGVAITGMIPAVKITSGSGGGGASSDKLTGGKGCQGCVVLKYPSSYAAPVSAQGATITVSNGYRIIAYTTVGAYTLTF